MGEEWTFGNPFRGGWDNPFVAICTTCGERFSGESARLELSDHQFREHMPPPTRKKKQPAPASPPTPSAPAVPAVPPTPVNLALTLSFHAESAVQPEPDPPEQKTRLRAKPAVEGNFVFKTKNGEPMKHRRVNRALEETLKRAKVEHCRFHDLRHTYASILIGMGHDVTLVADQMGHSSPNVTLGIYAKLFDPAARRSALKTQMQDNFEGVVQ